MGRRSRGLGRSSSMTAKPSTWGMSRSMTTTEGRDRADEVGGLLAARGRCGRPSRAARGSLRTSFSASGSSSTTTTLSPTPASCARSESGTAAGSRRRGGASPLTGLTRYSAAPSAKPRPRSGSTLTRRPPGPHAVHRVALQRREHLPAVHAGQVDVEDDSDGVLRRRTRSSPSSPVAGADDAQPGRTQVQLDAAPAERGSSSMTTTVGRAARRSTEPPRRPTETRRGPSGAAGRRRGCGIEMPKVLPSPGTLVEPQCDRRAARRCGGSG